MYVRATLDLMSCYNTFNAPHVVSVAEDATRIIKTVKYDPCTNKCVGFLLPTDNHEGLPQTSSYLVTSFEDIERYFSTNAIISCLFSTTTSIQLKVNIIQ
jgi:2-keto-3-deoxy-L-rhamnonate aldolase RhmA